MEARLGQTRWQHYAAVTGSALVLATGVPSLSAAALNEPVLRSVRLSMAAATLPRASAPTISSGGVVPLYGSANMIQPGSWVSIYGSNLAAGTAVWNGDFPTSLAGTSVTINGKPAYLYYVSPGQINLQAPDDPTNAVVQVVVKTAAGQASSTVTLNPYSPAFDLLDASHVTAIIVRSDGSGAFGGGAYDILGPGGDCFGYTTAGARPGDLVELFGVGFGPTSPTVPAGQLYSGAAPITEPFTLYINNVLVTPLFVGLSSAGLYQVNLIVPPGLGQGDVPIQAWVSGRATQKNVLFSLATTVPPVCLSSGDGDGSGDGVYGDGDGSGDGDGAGDGDGGDGGDGGGTGDGGGDGDGDGDGG